MSDLVRETPKGASGLTVFRGLAIAVFGVLTFAAVWMGGLNQDEGWYLYAANAVSEGRLPYRDFFFTQGPMMPYVYSAFSWVWERWGLLGARLFTLLVGSFGLLFAIALAGRLVPPERKSAATTMVMLLLGCNLYHLYYLAIPKTYALASLFVLVGFYLTSFVRRERSGLAALAWMAGAGLSLAFAAGTRISLGALMPVVGLWLLLTRRWLALAGFCLGGFGGLALLYAPFLCDPDACAGLVAAQAYHAARGGFDLTWTVGSLSRLVRWYLPVFIVLGLGVAHVLKAHAAGAEVKRAGGQAVNPSLLLWGFLAVFVVQMLAPFPYEDYQVPIMGLLTVYAVALFVSFDPGNREDGWSSFLPLLLVLGMAFANSFGSPLLEKWSTNGQDRFWSLKKGKYELAQLRDVAKRIEALDPGGKTLLTQDLYLAIETNRKVPDGFEMGPFSYWGDQLPYRSKRRVAFDDKLLREFLSTTTVPVAALSGYSFAITVPEGTETPVERQMEYWELLKSNYKLVDQEESFGQNATTLLVLKRK